MRQRWYLDSCALLNLYATKRLEELREVLEFDFLVTPWVAEEEALYVYEREGMARGRIVPVDLSTAFSSGGLRLESALSTEAELAMLIDLASNLDQGEAETIAAVILRGGALVTDDRKAIREVTARAPNIPVMTSIGLLKRWSEVVQPGQEELREVLLDVQIGGNFKPGHREPSLEWWTAILEAG